MGYLTDRTDEIALQLMNNDWFYYVNNILRYASAIALVILVILTSLSMTFDLVYLVFPMAKQLYDEFVENKEGNKFARAAVRLLVSKTAIQSFEEATEKSIPVMWVYMKRSIVHYITTAVLIVVLATGLDTILLVVYKIIRGMIEQLG